MKPGDILELEIDSALACLQLTHNHVASGAGLRYGWFCRVFSRHFPKRPTSRQLQSLAAGREQFGCFLSDVSRLEIVGHLPIPTECVDFPVFKQATGVAPSKSCAWIFWNGRVERVAARLPRRAATFPNREIVDSAVVQQRLKERWLSSTDVPLECIDCSQEEFEFDKYPLLSEFEANRAQYGDIWRFLASRGLYGFDASGERLERTGTGPFDNSAALTWLRSLQPASGWSAVLSALKRFQESPQRTAHDAAIAVAAAGVIRYATGKPLGTEQRQFDFMKPEGPVSLDVLRLAAVSLSAVLQRSGLRDTWESDERLPLWVQETSSLQLELLTALGKRTVTD